MNRATGMACSRYVREQLGMIRCGGPEGPLVSVCAIDAEMHALAQDTHHRSYWFAACRRIVSAEVLGARPNFLLDGKPMPLSAPFAVLVDAHWMRCAQDVLDAWWVSGLAAVRLTTLDDGNVVPTVIKGVMGVDHHIGTYVDPCDGRQHFVYYRIVGASRCIDADVRVLSNTGSEPGVDGALRSVVSTVLVQDAVHYRMMLYNLRGEALRSDPTMITQTTNTSAGVVRDESRFDYYMDMDQTTKDSASMFARNDAELEAERRQQLGVFGAERCAAAQAAGPAALAADFDRASALLNIYPLPVNHQLVTGVRAPPARADHVALERSYQEMVATAYGTSRSLLIADSGSARSSAHVLQRTSQRMVAKLQQALGVALTELYHAIYGEADSMRYAYERHSVRPGIVEPAAVVVEAAGTDCGAPFDSHALVLAADADSQDRGTLASARGVPRSRAARGAVLTEPMLFGDRDHDPKIVISFPTPAVAGSEETIRALREAWQTKIISWPVFRMQMHAQLGIPMATKSEDEGDDEDRDPWTDADKRSLMGIAPPPESSPGAAETTRPTKRSADSSAEKNKKKKKKPSSDPSPD